MVPVRAGADRALGVPDDVRTLGWWADGAAVGAAAGTVVLDGHVHSERQGPGALAHLGAVPLGALVHVTTASGSADYRVQARRSYDKAALPAAVFDRASAPQLVLITCGGVHDRRRHHYSDNVVVYASAARDPA